MGNLTLKKILTAQAGNADWLSPLSRSKADDLRRAVKRLLVLLVTLFVVVMIDDTLFYIQVIIFFFLLFYGAFLLGTIGELEFVHPSDIQEKVQFLNDQSIEMAKQLSKEQGFILKGQIGSLKSEMKCQTTEKIKREWGIKD